MRARAVSPIGIAALLITLFANPSRAQGREQQPPIVRVYSQNGAVASNYVTPAIEVSEDSYVFAVSMDLDGQIQVLHPDFPGISIRIREHRQLRLPNFFAGFAPSGGTYDASGRYASYSGYGDIGNDSRGTVIALASRAPFNLERIESDGDWNISQIRRLIEHRTPGSAAYALAAYLGAKGEPIGRDYMRFAGARNYYYASNALYSCDLYYGGYGSSLAFSRLAVLDRVARLKQAGQSVSIVGYDFCGMPIVAYGPSGSIPTGFQPQPAPQNPRDTSTARGHFPQPIPRSGPPPGNAPRAALDYYPITRREPPQMGDVTITAPNDRGRDPREIFIDLTNQSRGGGIQRAGPPLTHTAPTGSETTVIGTQPPSREYSKPVFHESPRSEPTGIDRSPPPPPVVQERPVSPPPPPPRVESPPRSKPVENTPPPSRQ
jgi:hypothetical protein